MALSSDPEFHAVWADYLAAREKHHAAERGLVEMVEAIKRKLLNHPKRCRRGDRAPDGGHQ